MCVLGVRFFLSFPRFVFCWFLGGLCCVGVCVGTLLYTGVYIPVITCLSLVKMLYARICFFLFGFWGAGVTPRRSDGSRRGGRRSLHLTIDPFETREAKK